jgi:hypothetical protein
MRRFLAKFFLAIFMVPLGALAQQNQGGIVVPPGPASAPPPGVVYVTGDTTGATDTTATVASAIDAVLNNNTQYQVVSFKPGAVYKMNNQVLRTSIPGTTTISLQGNGAVIDATGSTDNSVFDLEGSQGAAETINANINKSDNTISLTTNTSGIAAGDMILVWTGTYGAARLSTGATITSGVNCTVTGVNGGNWNIGDSILVSNQSSTPIPFGSTLSAVGTGCPDHHA